MLFVGSILEDKYKITNLIGEGSSGFVFKAVDTEGSHFAVKLMKKVTTATHVDDVLRFKHEADILSKLKHTNIAEVHSWGEFEGRPYLINRFLEGQSLEYILAAQYTFSIDESVQIILQLAEGLLYLHSNGIVHRDVKPSNIIITKETGWNACIIDFGMAYLKNVEDVFSSARIVGTLGYTSPEASGALNRVVDERSDLYSLGVTFYRLVTGKMPFEINNINKFYNYISYNPVRPSKLNILAAGIIDEIILKLLSKEPDMRYQSAQGLIHDLERIQKGDRSFIIGEKDQKLKLTYQTRLLGREKELEKLKFLFREAEEGRGNVCFVKGESGIGKSRLVEECKEYVLELKGNFFKGRFSNNQNKMPYKPFRDIIDQYISSTLKLPTEQLLNEKKRLTDFAGELGEILTKFNTMVEKLIGDVKPAVHLELEKETQRFLMVVSGLFYQIIGGKRPTVLYIDDFQWCDEGSITLLEEILKNIKSSKLLIIGTYRDNEVTLGHPLMKIIDHPSDFGDTVSNINLMPLTEYDVNVFIATILGEEPQDSEMLSRYLFEKSGGNPFFIISILRNLVEKGIITWQMGGWQKDWAQIGSIPYSKNVLDLILKNSDKLSASDEELLCIAAVVGKEFDIDILEKIAPISRDKIVSRIDTFIKLQLIEVGSNSKPTFSHDRIRDVFYNKLDEDRRKSLHLSIAQILESWYDSNDDKMLFDIVHHYIEAKDDEHSLRFLIPAARKSKETYANEEAFRYYSLALILVEKKSLKHKELWFDLKERLAEVCLTMGKNTQAIEFLKEILPFATGNTVKARIYRSIGKAYFKMGDWNNFEESISKALLLLGEKIPLSKVKITASIIKQFLLQFLLNVLHYKIPFLKNNYLQKNQELNTEVIGCYLDLCIMYIFNDSLKYLRSSLRLRNITIKSPYISEEKAASFLCYGATHIVFSDFATVLEYFFKAKEIREKLGNQWGVAHVMKFIALAYSLKGEHEKSIEYLNNAGQMFKVMGDLGEWGDVLFITANECHYIANYATGIQYYEMYIQICMNLKTSYGLINGYISAANCYTQMGDFKNAQQLIDKAFAVENKNELAYHNALIYKAYLEMEKDNCEEAIKIIEGLRGVLDSNRYVKEMTVIAYVFLLESHLKILESQNSKMNYSIHINVEELIKIKSICRKTLKGSKSWLNRHGMVLREVAKFYCLIGEYKKSEKLFVKSAEILTRIGMIFELGKCWFEYAKLLRLTAREDKSKEMILKAYEIFDQIGARGWKAKCKQTPELKPFQIMDAPSANVTTFENLKYKIMLNHVIDTGRYISSILDHEELLEKILCSSMEVLGACRGALLLYTEDGSRQLNVKAIKNSSGEATGNEWFNISESILSDVEQKKEPVLFHEAFSEDALKGCQSVFIQEIKSVICAPIMNQGEMLGAIYMDNNLVSGIFTEEDLKILELISSQAGVSIRNARLYRNLKDYMGELENSRDEIGRLNQSLEQKVVERTIQLEKANDELKQYAAVAEELAVARERNRVAREMHDTMGHTMTLLVLALEVCKITFKNHPEEAISKIDEALKITRVGLAELRASILGLLPQHQAEKNLIKDLEKLFAESEISGIKVNFTVEGNYLNFHENFYNIIYRSCQEALTNSIKHGKAKNASIILELSNTVVRLFIFDDGEGCKHIKKGVGLTGMTQRVEKLGGTLKYGSDGEKGFNICIELPVKNESGDGSLTHLT